MALGDGDSWDETLPSDATTATQIDDYNRDLRKGTRSRMALEHEWPASQSATSEAGRHKYITFQSQSTKPALSGTQVNAIYASTDNFYFEKSNGDVVQIISGTAIMQMKSYDYGTSLSASSTENPFNVIVCRGLAAVGANTSTSITNLPFASTSSYRLAAINSGGSAVNEDISIIQVSGARADLYNNNGLSRSAAWIAIGV